MKEDNNSYKYIIGLMLLGYIGIMIFTNIITPDRVFSDMENRRLEQVPKFSFEKLHQISKNILQISFLLGIFL